jgi:predicted Fe-Mo cluster-binding NifX family protein
MLNDAGNQNSHSIHSFRLALPVWESRISPVFDSAKHLWILEINDGVINLVEKISLAGTDLLLLGLRLTQMEVRAVICGAISHPLTNLLEASKIQVFSFVKGEVEKVIEAFLAGNLELREYRMAGSRKNQVDFASPPDLSGLDKSCSLSRRTNPRSPLS